MDCENAPRNPSSYTGGLRDVEDDVAAAPDSVPKTRSTAGWDRISPITGVFFMESAAVGKNCPNRYIRP